MPKFFNQPFAANGDKASIPDVAQPSGSVSYTTGWGPDYSLASSNPLSKDVPRQESNQLSYDITDNIGFLQRNGAPEFVPASQNGGAPLAYGAGAIVRYRVNSSSPFRTYISWSDNNTTIPTDPTNWTVLNYKYALHTDTTSVGIPVDPSYVTSRLNSASVALPDWSTSTKGIGMLADGPATIGLSASDRAVTPAGLGAAESARGWVTPPATQWTAGKARIATSAEMSQLIVGDAIVTPAGLGPLMAPATFSANGRVRLATPAEALLQMLGDGVACAPSSLTGYARIDSNVSFSLAQSSGGFNFTSDERVKQNLRANPYGLNDVLRLSTCVGQFRPDYNPDGRDYVFLIASNVAEVVPEAVRESSGHYNGEPVLTVNYDMMVPVLIRAQQQETYQRRTGEKVSRALAFSAFVLSVITAAVCALGG